MEIQLDVEKQSKLNFLLKLFAADPILLWGLLKSDLKVVGPWEPASNSQLKITVARGVWRCWPDGKSLVTISPSQQIFPPEEWEFYSSGSYYQETYFDDCAYEQAQIKYQENIKIWKPWSYRCNFGKGYADTLDDAKKLCDNLLRSNDIFFFD